LQRNEKKTYIVHPFLFAIFPIIFTFAHNIHLLPFNDFLIPLFAILGFSFILWVILRFFLNGKKAGLIVSLSLVLFFSYGHLYIFLNDSAEEISELGRHRYLLSFFAVSFIIGIIYFVKTKRKLNNVTTIVNVIAVTIVAISLVNIGSYYYERTELLEDSLAASNLILSTANAAKNPDIYYIIFDGYVHSDILKKNFDYDNQEILSFFDQNKFFLPTYSFSNYAKSNLSIISSLNMMHLTFLGEDSAYSKDTAQLNDLLAESKIMRELDAHGYTIVNFNAQYGARGMIKVSDLFLCANNSFIDSELLITLARTTLLNPVYVNLFEDNSRETILCVLSELPNVAERTEEPVFVFAHLLIPHPPYIFGPDGEKPDSIETLELGARTWTNKIGYLNQIEFANLKMKEIVSEILQEADHDPIIIIQADHGSSFTLDWENPTNEMLLERMSILNAYHFPGDGKNSLYETITPVNSFRVMLNAYFNGTYDLLEDRVYYSTYEKSFEFTDVTQILHDERFE